MRTARAHRSRVPCALVLVAALLPAACQFPRDADGTLERLRDGGALRVGVTERAPFVVLDDDRPTGVEVRLVERFARRVGAPVRYVRGSEEQLVERLERGELDVVAAGTTKRSPWREHVAPTRPYARTQERIAGEEITHEHVLLVRAGENALLVELERHLRDSRDAVQRSLTRRGER